MHTEDPVANDGGKGNPLEAIGKGLPNFQRAPSFAWGYKIITLVVEAVHPVDFRALVVAPEEKEVGSELDFVGEEEANALQGFLPPVHIIPQEEIVLAILGTALQLEDSQQVLILPMNVPADRYRRV